VGKFLGKQPLGRPTRRWVDNINMGLGEATCENGWWMAINWPTIVSNSAFGIGCVEPSNSVLPDSWLFIVANHSRNPRSFTSCVMAPCMPVNMQPLPVRWPIAMRNCSCGADHSPYFKKTTTATSDRKVRSLDTNLTGDGTLCVLSLGTYCVAGYKCNKSHG
jgi:hypothetical protein